MQTSTIDVGNGVCFGFSDSGAPSGSQDYTTVLTVHGLGWNADVLAKVLPRAGAHGVRVIAFHRRDYGTSSPFTEQEISPIRPKDDPSAVEAFMDARALEFAHLIRILIDRLNLPAAEHGHGGIAILGWSLGNMYGVDFLARATKLPQDLLAIVKKYIRSYVIFDASLECLGVASPLSDAYTNIVAGRATAAGKSVPGAINDWVSGWYDYSSIDASTNPAAEYIAANECPPTRPSTCTREAGNSAFEGAMQFSGMANEMILVETLLPGSYVDNVKTVLYADPEKAFWPGMRVEVAYCANTLWNVVYPCRAIQKDFEAAVPGRKVHVLAEANHFVIWEDADQFLTFVKPLL